MMRKLLFLFLIPSASIFAQNLKLMKATMQTINHGASPTSTTNFMVQLKKGKSFVWSVDSVKSALSNTINYNIVKVDDPAATSPKYQQIKSFSKKDKGIYQITFGSTKQNGSGRPGSPQSQRVDTEIYSNGIIIYYTVNKKKKEMKIDSFEELESIDAP